METLPAPHLQELVSFDGDTKHERVSLNCGWGRVIFAHTFSDSKELVESLLKEKPGQRDLAFYVKDPHVILSKAPQSLFLDPSHTYRLEFKNYEKAQSFDARILVRKLNKQEDIHEINSIYQQHKMMPFSPNFTWSKRESSTLEILVAEDTLTKKIVASVMGIDHRQAFDDPEQGTSLWALAVHKFNSLPGVGEMLIRSLIDRYIHRGRNYIDLSVMHDNDKAISLYEKLGFQRIPVYCIKHKNRINHPLFTNAPENEARLNPYAQIIIDEACKRGIRVDIIDAEKGMFKLKFAGRSINCIESLTDLTSATAFIKCSDKELSTKLLSKEGVAVPRQIIGDDLKQADEFLSIHKNLVVKPRVGEQGRHVHVGIQDKLSLQKAIKVIKDDGQAPIIQEYVAGLDLRVLVINEKVVAAAIRRPPEIVGDGIHTAEELIVKLDKRRRVATKGESRIVIDQETIRCLSEQQITLKQVVERNRKVLVRKTANLHTGGTIEDVTPDIHPNIIKLSELCATTLDIPVVGLDFIIDSPESNKAVFIEANERPGLANHEPQPVVESFIDLIFPESSMV